MSSLTLKFLSLRSKDAFKRERLPQASSSSSLYEHHTSVDAGPDAQAPGTAGTAAGGTPPPPPERSSSMPTVHGSLRGDPGLAHHSFSHQPPAAPTSGGGSSSSSSSSSGGTGFGALVRTLSNSTKCSNAQCETSFGFFDRKNTCRLCHLIFCSIHCSKMVRMNEFGQLHPEGVKQKVCDACEVQVTHNLLNNVSFTEAKSDLERRLSHRAERKDLVAQNIIHESTDAKVDSNLVAVSEQLIRRHRKDSLSNKLSMRPNVEELIGKHILTAASPEQVEEQKETVEKKLITHMITRPSVDDLVNRNIMKGEELGMDDVVDESGDVVIEFSAIKFDNTAEYLEEKLQRRPSFLELEDRNILIRFKDVVAVAPTYDAEDYDRSNDKTWTRLTNKDKVAIKKELNDFKRTMPVHEESAQYTRFHK
ncbi:hypothetical protein CAOG_06250 [Capsaspora owczarzaki ATCC 30864]|uniref:FYVE zinc finger domain-containing protein n=1 Tax=Capsaspora owczarzaki (strain ATCC 30864) TaxID=595528 RepID=A0A0D2VWB7_CAPO3|nr:hypothetical protein CAOG_06250 [Capsaspora owczarzaki ATCC 30864]KJE95847.1 hypothetical protein CAOG_006250 [Capsaspora owczarzaki ATCC 30864]|eukprot:XP_004344999.2 hypothetical protein CAOG_06250 [Capsaspora owczarzaki ATCC 30864]